MIPRRPKKLMPSAGVQSLTSAYMATACFGAILALIVIIRLDNSAIFARGLSLYEYWIVVSGALGGAIGLRMALPWFGSGQLRKLLVGILLMSFFAPIVAGTLALPLYGTMFGPFTLLVILAASPSVALFWVVTLIGADRQVANWRRERDSIFGPQPVPPLLPYWLRAAFGRAIQPLRRARP